MLAIIIIMVALGDVPKRTAWHRGHWWASCWLRTSPMDFLLGYTGKDSNRLRVPVTLAASEVCDANKKEVMW